MTKQANRVALVAGGSGIVGRAVGLELKRQGWPVRALARRPIPDLDTIPADLTDPETTVSALRRAADTTHLFYAALSQDPDLSVEAERNGRMLGNVLDGLEAARAPLQRVVSYEGFKFYGVHLGAKVRTPERESDPPHMPPNIYLSQRAHLKARGAKSNWDNVALSPDVVVGDPAPDFILPDAHGKPVRLQLLLRIGPVVVVFYRGGWCQYCNLHLRGFQQRPSELHARGAQVVAISPQLPDNSLSTQEKNELAFPVLSDVGNKVARQFGIAFELSDDLIELYREFGHALEDANGATGNRELPVPGTTLLRL